MYFGKAIRDNLHDLQKMQQAAWSAWYHVASTDDNPMHDFCDPDHCKIYRDISYRHEAHSLPPAVCMAIKPAYDELCSEESLRRTLNGGTTNANESFHRMLWNLCSKKKFHIRARIRAAANLATVLYNDGYIGLMAIYRSLEVSPNDAVRKVLVKIDNERIKEDQSVDPVLRLDRRRKNRLAKLTTEAKLVRKDPHKYGPGIAD